MEEAGLETVVVVFTAGFAAVDVVVAARVAGLLEKAEEARVQEKLRCVCVRDRHVRESSLEPHRVVDAPIAMFARREEVLIIAGLNRCW